LTLLKEYRRRVIHRHNCDEYNLIMDQKHNKKQDTFLQQPDSLPQQPGSLPQQPDSPQQTSPKEVIAYSIQGFSQELINIIIYHLDIIELACLRQVSKQLCHEIIPYFLVMKNGNDGENYLNKISTQARALVLRRIILYNDSIINITKRCKNLEYFHIGDYCNWVDVRISLEGLIYLRRLCMTVNLFNSKGEFHIIGHESSILESFIMNILCVGPNTFSKIPDKCNIIIVLAFTKCTKLEFM
jgi:hypothetical protein